MMSRALLHISKLQDFTHWLTENNIPWREGKGAWQILQICKDGKHWNGVYQRLEMPEHYTTDKHLDSLVARFCRKNRK